MTRDWRRAAPTHAARRELAEAQIPGLCQMYPCLTAGDCRVVNRSGDTPVLSTDAAEWAAYPWVVEYDRAAWGP